MATAGGNADDTPPGVIQLTPGSLTKTVFMFKKISSFTFKRVSGYIYRKDKGLYYSRDDRGEEATYGDFELIDPNVTLAKFIETHLNSEVPSTSGFHDEGEE